MEFLSRRTVQKMTEEHGDQRRSDLKAKESWQVVRYVLRGRQELPMKVRWA